MIFIRFAISSFVSYSALHATWFDNIPRKVMQPDGQEIECFVTGDQYARRLHDENNYTIIMKPEDGYYYYADNDSDGDLVPTELKVGYDEPWSMGLVPGKSYSQNIYNRKKATHEQYSDNHSRDAPSYGVINQINIFIRFADDPDFPSPRSYYDAVFQTDEDEPSLKHYFNEISYNNLTINTYHYPRTSNDLNISYVDDRNRSYYQPYSNANPEGYFENQRADREHELLKNAVEAISPIVGPGDPWIDVDSDNDGFVDAVSFVIYGSPGDWADLLWPHRWVLFSDEVNINGSRVYDYLFMLSESWYFNVGVLCHEFGHVLGAPDYYHYDGGGAPTPVGSWDVMASNGNPPQYPSAFTMWKYFNWINLEEITQSGTYTLNPLQQQNNVAYRIASPNSEDEYFVVEYRMQTGLYDVNAPGARDGIVAYRVNPNAGNGNAQGPPDELYVYRPGGNLNNNGNFEQAPYNLQFGHTDLNDDTDPSSFLYNDGAGGDGGLNLFNVGNALDNISFNISFGFPSLVVDPATLQFQMGQNEYISESFFITNAGGPETALTYDISITSPPPYANPQGGPDGNGYYWTTSDSDEDLTSDWIDIDSSAIQISFPGNDQFSNDVIDLPFQFPFFGETYNYLQVNANGWVGWNSSNENAWENGEIPSGQMPRPAIFGFYDDLNPLNDNSNQSSAGNVYYSVDDQKVIVWFNNVARWPGSAGDGIYDFQIVLHQDGRISCNYAQMIGTIDQATIGWQNSEGTQGTQIQSVTESVIGQNMSWEADNNSDYDDSWLSLSMADGIESGTLIGGESIEGTVAVSTVGMDVGVFQGQIVISSVDVDTVVIPITLNLLEADEIPILPFIDISVSDNGIVMLPENVDSTFSNIANRYTHFVTDDGFIPMLIQDEFTVEQIIHVRDVLSSYLTDVGGSQWGENKTQVANAIAASNAMFLLLDNEEQYESSDMESLIDAGVLVQDVLATEVILEGSNEYVNNEKINSTYEKVLNFIYDYGIKSALPEMQSEIISAMNLAIDGDYFEPDDNLLVEDYDERYFAIGLECYFGLWSHDPNGDGYCGNHEYAFISRDSMMEGDFRLFDLVQGFVGETWNYTAMLPASFEGTFSLLQIDSFPYTFRSQYLSELTARGNQNISIIGNDHINKIFGNNGDNIFYGYGQNDTLDGMSGIDRAFFRGDLDDYVIIPPTVTLDSSYRILDAQFDRDGMDILFDIEEVQFNTDVYELNQLLSIIDNNMPIEFKLYSPYPNPFNPVTNIGFDVPIRSRLKINVFDINGKLIKALLDEGKEAGKYKINWDGTNSNGDVVSTGIYFIKFMTRDRTFNQKVLFLK